MRTSLHHALKFLQQPGIEGGYVNDPKDPGGCTNMGITIGTFRAYVNPHGTCKDLKALTVEQAELVYEQQYWLRVGGDALPAGVDVCVFDLGVNAGTHRAVVVLQNLLGVARDGRPGELTLAAAAEWPARKLITEYCEARRAYYRRLGTFYRYGKGWLARVDRCEALALQLAEAAA